MCEYFLFAFLRRVSAVCPCISATARMSRKPAAQPFGPPDHVHPQPPPRPPTHTEQTLLSQHGVVCVSRNGSDTAQLLDRPGSLLHTYRRNVTLVQEPVPNEISSSRVRPPMGSGLAACTPRRQLGDVMRGRRWGSTRFMARRRPCTVHLFVPRAMLRARALTPGGPSLLNLLLEPSCPARRRRCGTSWSSATRCATCCPTPWCSTSTRTGCTTRRLSAPACCTGPTERWIGTRTPDGRQRGAPGVSACADARLEMRARPLQRTPALARPGCVAYTHVRPVLCRRHRMAW